MERDDVKKSEEAEETDDDVTGYVYNLSASLSNLDEIDGALYGCQDDLTIMRQRIFSALIYYCSMLPEPEDE